MTRIGSERSCVKRLPRSVLCSHLDWFRLPPHRSGPAGIASYSTMCRERLDQFCDRHDLALRAALLIVPAVIYASYIAWAADRFDFICGSFGNYKSFAAGIAVWMLYFLVLPLFLWRKFRRKHGPIIWLAMLVLWELQIIVAVVDKHAHVEKLSSHQFWRFFHYAVSAALLLFGPFQMQWLAPDDWKQRCRRGPPVLVVAYLVVFVIYLAGPLPKAGAIIAELIVMFCYLLALLVVLPGLQKRPEAPSGTVLRQMESEGV